MERKTRLSVIIISALGISCILLMLIIEVVFGFYFGPEKDDLKSPSLSIENTRGCKNTLPNWYLGGSKGYKLLFAANLTEGEADFSGDVTSMRDEAQLMLVEIDPFKKEIIRVENNIYRDNPDDSTGNFSLNGGSRYRSIPLRNGILAYEEDKDINYGAYYTFNHAANPVLAFYGNPSLAYIRHKGGIGKPVIAVKSLSGGNFTGGSMMQNQQAGEKIISVPAGELVGWVQGSDLVFSSAKLNKNFEYVNMHDLWTVSVNGGQPRKIHENAYCPVMYDIDGVVVFLSREKEGNYGIWKAYYAGNAEKISEFHYTSREGELPSISIINASNEKELEVCYTASDEKGQVSIQAVNSNSKVVRTLVKNQSIIGPIISSYNIDAGQGKYILYFTEEQGNTKANIIDNQGKIQSEIYDLLKTAPAEPYIKEQTKQ